MKHRTRTYYTTSQKALMWERWRQGWTLHRIAHLFDRLPASVREVLSRRGGIRPPERTNENTSDLLRQYTPTGVDIWAYSQAKLNAVARQLNKRPRKTLGFKTPAQMFSRCVALTG
jgi:hypothetical protein